jgi:excinuclease UvrABC nuclease subunit
MVHDVVAFLDGRDEVLNERLLRGLEQAAAKLDFEAAARLRNDIQSVNAIVGAQQQLRQAAETHTLLLVLPSTDAAAREVLLVVAGRIWAQLHAMMDDPADLAARLSRSWDRLPPSGPPPVDHDSVDEANILNRWLYRNAGHPAVLPLPQAPSWPDWPALAVLALALTEEDLTRDVFAFEETDNPVLDVQSAVQD